MSSTSTAHNLFPLGFAAVSFLCICLATTVSFCASPSPSSLEEVGSNVDSCHKPPRSRFVRIFCFVTAVSGLGTSIYTALWATTPVAWVVVAAWALTVVQCTFLLIAKTVKQRFSRGISVLISAICNLFAQAVAIYRYSAVIANLELQRDVHEAIPALQLILSLSLAIACSTLPRLPQFQQNGRNFDPERAGSLFQRYMYTWADPLFDIGKQKIRMQIDDLPALGLPATAASLLAELQNVSRAAKQPLWKSIYQSHKGLLHLTWFLTILECIAAFVPQICTYEILQTLERHGPDASPINLWLWVIGLGASSAFYNIVESRFNYVAFGQLEVRARAQLAAVIFDKVLRLDDIKTARKSISDPEPLNEDTEPQQNDEEEANETSPLLKSDQAGQAKATTTSTEPKSNSDQQVLNLIAVDAVRVSEMVARCSVFISAFITFVIAVVFLVLLIGWTSFCLGISIPFIFIKINKTATGKYMKAQQDLLEARDEKLKVVAEGLKGIKQIKFTASEDRWEARIMDLRNHELSKQRTAFVWAVWLRVLWYASPVLVAMVSLSAHALLRGGLSASVAFTAIGVFKNLELCMSVIPMASMSSVEAIVSSSRISKFLELPEKKQYTLPGPQIIFKDATVTWPTSDTTSTNKQLFRLKQINAEFPNHSFSIIHGPSGSGKSLMLSSIIGEAPVIQGTVTVPRLQDSEHYLDRASSSPDWILPGTLAYVSQIPWIENASIKDNILFGLPMKTERYQKVLEGSALLPDLEVLIDGDLTEIGPQGINLSGGQRWRLTFARALYSRAEILILDDVFSAVDTHVGTRLMRTLTGDLCKGRTRILATHHASRCLPHAEYAIRLGDGGHVAQITNFADHQQISKTSFSADSKEHDTFSDTQESKLDQSHSSTAQVAQKQNKPRVFVEDEHREEGSVKLKTYHQYLLAVGGPMKWITGVTLVFLAQAFLLGRLWWIKVWTQSDTEPTNGSDEIQRHGIAFYLSIYVAISISSLVFEIVKTGAFYAFSLKASRVLFQSLLHTVLRAPIRWLDTVPTGRILNRFTADFAQIDSRVPSDFYQILSTGFELSMVFASGLVLSYYMTISAVVLTLITLHFARRFMHGAREVKRLESISKSPIMELCGSTLSGLGTVRAFGVVDAHLLRMWSLVDNYTTSGETFHLVSNWLGTRMGLLGSFYALSVGLTIAGVQGIDASLAGLALTFALSFSRTIEEAVRRFASLQVDMNAVERAVEYTEMHHESEDPGLELPTDWPISGEISFEGVEAAYAKDLPLILKDVNVNFTSKQRIGVVGRSGSGKSSFALALYRFLELSSGHITIDGIDVSKIGLKRLRSKMSIIPQDPVLFAGTIKSNLDPFGEFTDDELRERLGQVELVHQREVPDDYVNVFDDLDYNMSEGGLNLSQGQRQLLCLARATLAQSKIMILDEATSAVDRNTDELIQQSIRKSFTNSTLIVIAHRLSTVADFDRIMVMDDGRVAEFGVPQELYKAKGAFYDLVNDSGEQDELLRLLAIE